MYKNYNRLDDINISVFASSYDSLERKRLAVKNPEDLLIGKKVSTENRDLYNYYDAFKNAGADPENIERREKVFVTTFESSFNSLI